MKEIIGLPMCTNDNLIYSPRILRGLGLVRCKWEVFLQHFSIAQKLIQYDDSLFQSIGDCSNEITTCTEHLGVTGKTSRELRLKLRTQSFESWCGLRWQGAGVIHFQTYLKSNDF